MCPAGSPLSPTNSAAPKFAGAELLPVRLMIAGAAVLPIAAAGISLFSRADHRVPVGRQRRDRRVGRTIAVYRRGRPVPQCA